MTLPKPETLVVTKTPLCCRPILKEWLDELASLKQQGKSIPGQRKLVHIVREAGFNIGRDTIANHMRNHVPAPSS